MLEALGISPDETAVYRAVVRLGEARLIDVSSTVGNDANDVGAAIGRLEALGLVSRNPDDVVVAVRPDLAIDALVAERESELQRAVAAARAIAEEFRAEQREEPSYGVADIVRGRSALQARYRQLQLGAREEVLTFDRPPYVSTLGVNEDEIEHLTRGARSRGIYDTAAFDVPGQLDWLAAAADAGEEARVLGGLPLKMSIADRRVALIPLTMDAESVGSTGLLIGPSALLDALVMLFEALWERAVPLESMLEDARDDARPTEVADVDVQLLTLLTAGLGDDAIARQLQVSARTVRRRVAALMDLLDARSRFQAGVQARARGLI
ncbi:helix-turn-helix domain-containing protein [Nocardioides jensenii]|uniref:helix-turn-helix domain-containing protein n=1 Tax=Nocardioides jensenii TaxID=1843 RepID=UPI0008295E16|nr:helix-turn-helix domain-containing protein [Nocardioides jensenii]